jgi:hypothetical protein
MSDSNELTYERWQTPVSTAKSVALVSLWQDADLHLVLEDLKDPERNRYRISFSGFAAYKNTMEEYLIGAQWTGPVPEWTRVAVVSPWLQHMKLLEPLFKEHHPDCRHYIVVTEDDVIEVLTSEAPVVVYEGRAPDEAPTPGRSVILQRDDPAAQQYLDSLAEELREQTESKDFERP